MISDVKAVSSLEKVFVDSSIDSLVELKQFSMLKNEKKSFRLNQQKMRALQSALSRRLRTF